MEGRLTDKMKSLWEEDTEEEVEAAVMDGRSEETEEVERGKLWLNSRGRLGDEGNTAEE